MMSDEDSVPGDFFEVREFMEPAVIYWIRQLPMMFLALLLGDMADGQIRQTRVAIVRRGTRKIVWERDYIEYESERQAVRAVVDADITGLGLREFKRKYGIL